MPTATAKHELADLSDQDINFLYNVILEAQRLPLLPLRALFAAYEKIRQDGALDPEKDKLYFLFLLRMGEEQAGDDSLYGRFKSLLARTGIHVEPDEFEGHIEDITRRLDLSGVNGAEEESSHHEEKPRRASFGSMVDHLTDGEHVGASIKENLAAYLAEEARRPSSRASDHHGLGSPRALHRSNQHQRLLHRGGQHPRVSTDPLMKTTRSAASVSSQGSLKITRRYSNGGFSHDENYSADESEDMDLDEPSLESLELRDHVFAGYRRQDDLVQDAIAFRAETLRRQAFAKWVNNARNIRRRHEASHAQATEHDRRILLQSGFDMWRERHQQKTQAVETERFFVHMERRADRAREVYLITKAFTHWRHNAAEEINRTSVAKRHILRMRYFSAWKDITAVNMLKIRKHTLTKFMGKWKQRKAAVDQSTYDAVIRHEDNLVARHYWRWFWVFCEHRVPGLHLNHLRQDLFARWFNIAAQLRDREAHVEAMCVHQQQRRALGVWRNAVQITARQHAVADNFDRRRLLNKHIVTLRRESQLRPIFSQVKRTVDERALRFTIRSLQRKIEERRAAETWCRQRRLRSCIEEWKCQVVASRIDERLVVSAVYQWMLAARVPLIRRAHDAGLRQSIFSLWKNKTRAQARQLHNLHSRVNVKVRERLVRSCFDEWRNRREAQAHNTQVALSLCEPRIKARVLRVWISRHQQLQELERWSSDAFLYVSAKHALAAWRSSTDRSRKERKRDAYTAVRKRVKMNLARRLLLQWRDAAAMSLVSQRRATEMQENRLMTNVMTILHKWQQQAQDVQRMETHAESVWRRTRLGQTLHNWSTRYSVIVNLQERGQSLSAELVGAIASTSLKSLDRRLFHIRLQQQNAQQLHQRSFEKHQRNMLRHWLYLATRTPDGDANYVTATDLHRSMAVSRSAPPALTHSQLQAVTLAEPPEDSAIARNETFSALDLDLHLAALPDDAAAAGPSTFLTSTPLRPPPGYMRTPSRRDRLAARGMHSTQHLQQRTTTTTTTTTPAGEPPAFRPRGGAMSAPPGPGERGRMAEEEWPVSSFRNQLRLQGVAGRRFAAATTTPKRVGFGGFESIEEWMEGSETGGQGIGEEEEENKDAAGNSDEAEKKVCIGSPFAY